jgi:transposase
MPGSRGQALLPPKYSTDLNPIERVFVKLKHLLKAAAAQSAKSSEHLRSPNAPTISEIQAMPNPKSIML